MRQTLTEQTTFSPLNAEAIRASRWRGLLLGTAVGDAVGLPLEGLKRERIARWCQNEWRHRFFFGRSMISDDTEHTLFTAQCLLAHPANVDAFARRLGWCLRGWFATLPAGIGLATARACIKLWLGCSPRHSGVRSAGNGPAMRVAPVGAFFAHDSEKRRQYVEATTRLTHTDPKALTGALAIAETAAWIMREGPSAPPPPADFCQRLRDLAPADAEWCQRIGQMEEALIAGQSVDAFARNQGLELGISGYIYHTVPMALFAWHRHFGDYRTTLGSIFACGGDTDTVAAITGALAGLTVGEDGLPGDWVAGIRDWPRSTTLLRRVADRVATAQAGGAAPGPVRYFWPGLLLRNALFLAIVLTHGFMRLRFSMLGMSH